ncbi:MAG: hypothetical protein R6V47_03460 [Candidatus Delongbacteria bacterium]
MKTIICSIFIFFITQAYGGGKYAGEFISSGTDARSLSLGNILLTSFNTAAAVYHNPAYLPELEHKGILLSHSERFEGFVQQDFVSFNTSYSGIDAGIALLWLNIDNITFTRLENEDEPAGPENRILPDRSVSDNEFALFLSAGKKFGVNFNLGGSVKFLYKTFETESAAGTGLDLSGMYKLENIVMGLKLQDILTSALFWTTGKNEFIRPSIIFSTEYNNKIDYFLADYKLIAGTKIRTENYSNYSLASYSVFDIVFSGGLELIFKNISLRGGYNTDDTWTAGSGLSFMNFILDYTFRPDFEDLGNTHKASLSYIWK